MTSLFSQGTNMMTNRVHPELEWKTISTENFNIHYHQGIEDIARDGAKISEHVLPTLLKQVDLDSIPMIDVIFTNEDEIMNGFAIPTYQTFIWVDQNDAARWLEKNKWLEQVVAHELQHIVYFHKTRSWLKTLGVVFSGTPGWFVEGLAEYETESWRPYRADLAHKSHILRNKTNTMDPHHDGFSKLLYMADRFGDSTIVKTMEYRNGLKLFSFKEGFKKATGISVKQFNEDWRRLVNTYYYSYRSQKESYDEIGKVFSLPYKRVKGFEFYSDSSQMAVIGSKDKGQLDISLIIAERDTAKESKRYADWEKKNAKIKEKKKLTKKDSLSLEKPYKEKIIWSKKEIDFGDFHPELAWSNEGSKLAYAKYHHGENQSLVYDIKVYDKKTDRSTWLTQSKRATYPAWVDSNRIAYVAHQNSIANIFISDLTGKTEQITDFTDNTQIMFTAISPDKESLAMAVSPENGNLDIYILNLTTKELTRLTTNENADIMPVWHPSGTAISYTSNANGVPNIHTINLSNQKTTVNTDVGDGIWTKQWMPNDSAILAMTLNAVDSLRLVKVDPFRSSNTSSFNIRDKYSSWLNAGPDVSFVNEEITDPVDIATPEKYKFTKHLRNFITLALPFGNSFTALSMRTDALGKNNIMAIGNYYRPNPDYSSVGLSYSNAGILPGILTIGFSRNFDPAVRLYNKANMIDFRNGIRIGLSMPFNFGESFSSNHDIDIGISFINHDVIVFKEVNEETGEPIEIELDDKFFYLPFPEEKENGYISLGYKWTNLRPHQRNVLMPSDGFGIKTNFNWADKSLFGEYSYSIFETDFFGGFKNFYLRLKTKALTSGKQPNQNLIGLTNDDPIYIGGTNIDENLLPETYNPRGWDEIRIGESMVFGSMEIRLPIIPGALSLNLISDFGNAWSKGTKSKDWVQTAGYEVRLGLGFVFLSAGEAQTIENWNDDLKPKQYLRATLIRPF